EGSCASEALELRRRAAAQLLRSGHIDEGLKVIESVLTAVNMHLPSTDSGALLSALFRRTLVRARGFGFRLREETEIPASELQRIDICWSVAEGLTMVDLTRGHDFQERGLLLALRAGEPFRLARALALETV